MPGSTTLFELCTKKWAEGPGMFDDFAHGIVVTERRWYEEKRHTYPYITWKVSTHRRAARRAPHRAAHCTAHTQPGGRLARTRCPMAAPPPRLPPPRLNMLILTLTLSRTLTRTSR